VDLEMCHLFLLPAGSAPGGAPEPSLAPRDAPDFFEVDIDVRSAGDRTIDAAGTPVTVSCQIFDGQVWLADCRYRLTDAFAPDAAIRKQAIEEAIDDQLLQDAANRPGMWVRYTVVLVQTAMEDPDRFVDANAPALARLVRTLPKPPDEVQVGEILRARARFSENDLTIVDWVGAVVLTELGDSQSDVELFKIGNYQLMRYRMLDRGIERNLHDLRAELADPRPLWRPGRQRTIATVVEKRLELLLAFEKTAQSLMFIGNWYSARVYSLIVRELCLEDWRSTVSGKLESLAAIDQTVRESLTFSWRRVLDMIQLVGWAFLLVGYLVLFFLNVR
jgi:hypothetical protein